MWVYVNELEKVVIWDILSEKNFLKTAFLVTGAILELNSRFCDELITLYWQFETR